MTDRILADLTRVAVIVAGVLAAADLALFAALDPPSRAAFMAGLRLFFGVG